MEFKEFVSNHILKYINNNKEIDEEFFYDIVDYFINMYSLTSYLHELVFYRKNSNADAEYMIDDRVINIYTNTLNKTIILDKEYFEDKINKFELEYLTYLIVVKNIVHELIHVYQCSILNKIEKSLEEELIIFESTHLHNLDINMLRELNIDINKYTRKVNKFIKKYYDSLLCERLAEHYSIYFIDSLLSEESTILKEYYKDIFTDNLLRGYEYEDNILISPTYRVYKGIHKLIGIREFDYQWLNNNYEVTKNKVKTLDFKTRVKLGLPISDDEFDKLMKS